MQQITSFMASRRAAANLKAIGVFEVAEKVAQDEELTWQCLPSHLAWCPLGHQSLEAG